MWRRVRPQNLGSVNHPPLLHSEGAFGATKPGTVFTSARRSSNAVTAAAETNRRPEHKSRDLDGRTDRSIQFTAMGEVGEAGRER